MPPKIQIKRGAVSSIPTLDDGELGFTVDTHELYVGYGGVNYVINGGGGGGGVSSVTASAPLASSGGSTPNISLTGTIPTARLGTGTADNTTFLRGDQTWVTISGGGGGVTDVTASSPLASSGGTTPDISLSGTIPTANLGSGTADNTTFLRGDQTWVTISGGGGGVSAVTASSPLSSSGGTTPDISLTGTIPTARLGSGTANNTTYLRGDQTWATISGGGSLSIGDAIGSAVGSSLLVVDSSGNLDEITPGTTGLPLLAVSGSIPAFAQVDTAGIADGAITAAKLAAGVGLTAATKLLLQKKAKFL